MDEPGPEQDEARRQEEAIVKCLKTVWDPSKPIPHLPSSMTTAAPGSAPLDSSGRKQSQPSERHVELVQDTINMLESYGEQAEEGLVYYRRAMERLAGTSISTNAGANNSAGTTPTATSPVTGAFFSRSSAFSESARGNAVGSPGTRNTAGASTAETPRRDSGAARGISAVANEYDASRDPRLKR